jgi:anti-sigma-K factor RskA
MLSLAETEYAISRIKLDNARKENERAKKKKTLRKCIKRLHENTKPYTAEKAELAIGVLPSGRAQIGRIVDFRGLEGDPVEEFEEGRQPQDKRDPITDGDDLYYLCGKETDG